VKKILLSTAALIGFTSLAAAADLPVRAAPPAPVAAVPVFTWTGFYAGIHGAWIRNDVDAIRTSGTTVPAALTPARVSLYDDGFGGGGQVGYLMQFGSIVAGLEADITVTDIGRSRSVTFTDATIPTAVISATTRVSSNMDFIGTVKGRLGVTFPSFLPFFQQSMIYVTGGLGYADIDNRVRVSGSVGPVSGRGDDIKVGFVVGGGTESAITRNISIKTETLYYNLEDDTVATNTVRANTARYRFENDGWISKVGLNVRF
jgi:outer membrane immunogenic protein